MNNKKVLIDAIRNLSNPRKTNKNKNYFDISNTQDSDFISAKNGVDTPIYKKVSVKPSPIAGRGLFAEQYIRAGEPIGISHIRKKFMRDGEEYQAPFPSTTLGYYNHSKEPNVYEVDKGGHIVMLAGRDINPGDEITANYDQNEIEDLEGSSDFKRGGSTKRPSLPSKKSPRSYSRSLEATNRLFAQHPLFKKPQSRKNKIFDPNSQYYQDGGLTQYAPGGVSADPPDWLTKRGASAYFNPMYNNSFTGSTSTYDTYGKGFPVYKVQPSAVVGIKGSLSKNRYADREAGRGWAYDAYVGMPYKKNNYIPSAGIKFDYENSPQDKNFRPHADIAADFNSSDGFSLTATGGARFPITPYGNKKLKPGAGVGHADIYGGGRIGISNDNADAEPSAGVVYGARVHGEYMPKWLNKLSRGSYFYGNAGAQFDPVKGKGSQNATAQGVIGGTDPITGETYVGTMQERDPGTKWGATFNLEAGIAKKIDNIKFQKNKRSKKIQDIEDEEIEYQRMNPPANKNVKNTTFGYNQDGGIPLNLTDAEIQEYAKGGYIIEDYDPSVTELNTYAEGGWLPKAARGLPVKLSKTIEPKPNKITIGNAKDLATNSSAAQAISAVKDRTVQLWNTPEGQRRLQNLINTTPSLQANLFFDSKDMVSDLANTRNMNQEIIDYEALMDDIAIEQNKVDSYYDQNLMEKNDYFNTTVDLDTKLKKAEEEYAQLLEHAKTKGGAFYDRNESAFVINPQYFNNAALPKVGMHEVIHLPGLKRGVGRTSIDEKLGGLDLKDQLDFDFSNTNNNNSFYKHLNRNGNYLGGAKSYYDLNGGFERSPFLAELREDMLQNNIIKHPYQKVNSKMIKNYYTDYLKKEDKYPLRIFDIMTNKPKNFSLLSNTMNELPSFAPYVIGAGAATLLDNPFDAESNTEDNQYAEGGEPGDPFLKRLISQIKKGNKNKKSPPSLTRKAPTQPLPNSRINSFPSAAEINRQKLKNAQIQNLAETTITGYKQDFNKGELEITPYTYPANTNAANAWELQKKIFPESMDDVNEWYKNWYAGRMENPKFKDLATKRYNAAVNENTPFVLEATPYFNTKHSASLASTYQPKVGDPANLPYQNKIVISNAIFPDSQYNVEYNAEFMDPKISNDYFIREGIHEKSHWDDNNYPQNGINRTDPSKDKILNKFLPKEYLIPNPQGGVYPIDASYNENNIFDPNYNGLSEDVINYQERPTEIRARLNVWRMMNNIDPRRKYSVKEIESIINKNIKDSKTDHDYRNIIELYKVIRKNPEILKELNDSYVSNDSIPQDEYEPQMAKYGGSLSTYAEGGESGCPDGFEEDPVTGECIPIREKVEDIEEVPRSIVQKPPWYQESFVNPAAYVSGYRGGDPRMSKYSFLTSDNGNIIGGGGFGFPKPGVHLNALGVVPTSAKDRQYFKGAYEAGISKDFKNLNLGLGVGTAITGYPGDNGFVRNPIKLQPKLNLKYNFAEGGTLNKFVGGGMPDPGDVTCPDGYIRSTATGECVLDVSAEQTPADEWYKNWYTNRVIQDVEGQKLLNEARPKLLKRTEQFPEIDYDTKGLGDSSGMYNPMTGKISLNSSQMTSPFIRDEVLFHEKGHYLTSPSMLDPEMDTYKEMKNHPVHKLREYETGLVNEALVPKNKVSKEEGKFYDYISGNYGEEMSKRIMELRRLAGFKPDQEITDDDLKNFYQKAKTKGWTDPNSDAFVPALIDFQRFINSPQDLKMLLNKMAKNESRPVDEYAPQQAQYGGSLPKAKMGWPPKGLKRTSGSYKAPNINFNKTVPTYIPNPIKKTLRDINIETLGTLNAVAKGLLPTKVNPMQVLTLGHPIEGVGPFTGSPLNSIPFYGTKLPEDAKNPVAGVAFRKFGDTLDWVKNTGELNPAHGSALRFGKDQISKEGNWSEMGWANEKYPGVFAAGFDSHVPGSNLQINGMDKRNGVVVTEGDNPAISIMDPGVRLHRRLPFSNRYVDINMDKLRNDQFDWRTMGGNAQSLIERYGYTAGYAALLSALGLAAPQDKVDQYINEPIIRSYEEYIEPLINPKEEDGGEIDYELGQEIDDEATMEKLKKLGYTFQKIK